MNPNESLQITTEETPELSGKKAARHGADIIRKALENQGQATIIVATGASQFHMLAALIHEPNIDWSRVTAFHLDEYIGMPISHPASFRKYLKERFVDQLPGIGAFHYVNGENDPADECERLKKRIAPCNVDVAFIGIGENGHLAFNDPPADFETREPYIVVNLNEDCRRQQLGEGWFKTLEEVPTQAISMSIQEILRARTLICTVPDKRKAKAVRDTLENPVSPESPSTILRQHGDASLYLDKESASLIQG